MPKVDPALWRDIMEDLRVRHTSICRQWFEHLEPVDLDTGLLRVATPTPVQRDYLQRKCIEQFNDAAQAVTGNLVAVRFVTEQEAAAISIAPENISQTAATSLSPAGVQTAGNHTALMPPPGMPRTPRSSQPSLPPFEGDDHRHDDQIVLSPDNSFENFVTGPNNQLAYAAAIAVANQPGTTYNPLFIHGGVGLGKTHLLQAICQQILTQKPDTRILYVSCDAFMNQFIECVQAGKMAEFRHRYRYVDMLVLDDIHFLGGGNRERSQEEFFHTFNELYQSNQQIVLSSDAPPTDIPHLEERLVSRFNWGLVAQVTKPHYETRVAILRAKAELRSVKVPDEVINYIAGRMDTNARELEGAITTIIGHASLQHVPIDLALAKTAFGDPENHSQSSQVTLQQIIDVVTQYYNVKLSDLQSRRRHKSVTEPRQVCMYLARQHTRFSLEEIGGYFGGRDHTTVMHSIRTVGNRSDTESTFAQQITHLNEQVAPSGSS